MQQSFPWLIIIAMALTFLVMAMGVIGMLRPGKASSRRSNILMRYRILFQGVAIALVAIAFLIGRN
jgi:quinol-cytochrome oxidoreductase complex cytochrome b subunit